MPELVPAPHEARIHKRFESAFEETPLEDELAKCGASHVTLAGAMTNWCIRATAYAALDRGYDLTLVADAHTTSPMSFDDGTSVAAAGIVRDLNTTTTWIAYPGRRARTAKTDELEFAA